MRQEIKILLVEDDEDDALLTKEYLSDIGNYNFSVEIPKEYSIEYYRK